MYDLFHGQWLLDRDHHQARYPFGFGLSYALAALGDVTVDVGETEITVTLANAGNRDTTEVVQVYAGTRAPGVERPPWRLVAFARTDVPARGATAVRLVFPVDRLAIRIEGAWVIEPGPYEVAVSLHAQDPKAILARIEVAR